MEFDYDPHTFTLEDLEQARIKLGREFSLSKLALFLVKIVSGSVVLVCILPEGMVWRIDVDKNGNKSFRNLKLVRLHLNNECIYHIDLPRKFGHNINNTILSTPDSCGLAIITDRDVLKGNRQRHSSLGINGRTRWLSDRFKDYNFAFYILNKMNKLKLDAIMYAASHYLNLPNTSNYPILFAVSSFVHRGDMNLSVSVNAKIDFGKDIIEPLVSSEHLADNPKIIIIEAYRGESLDLSQLRTPQGQNFIVALFNATDDNIGHVQDVFVEWRIHRSKMIDIEERLLKLESQKFKSMIVRSHLEQPIYVCPVS